MRNTARRKTVKGAKYPRCQCIASCHRKSLPHSPFCEIHQLSCPRKPTLTGAELPAQKEIYNTNTDIHDSHNCFAYAFGMLEKGSKADDPFPQPGVFSGYPSFRKTRRKTCPDMIARLIGDTPSLRLSNFSQQCPPNYYKIAMAVDARSGDYHFWRQNPQGLYDHKPGSTDVSSVDAYGRPIYDVALASRNYTRKGSHLNYNRFCGYMCVPRKSKPRISS